MSISEGPTQFDPRFEFRRVSKQNPVTGRSARSGAIEKTPCTLGLADRWLTRPATPFVSCASPQSNASAAGQQPLET